MQHKLVVRDSYGNSHWEQGGNRLLTAPADGGETTIQVVFRD